MSIEMPQIQELTIGDIKLKNLFENTSNTALKDFGILNTPPVTRSALEELDRKFPINERKEFIEKKLISELPNNIWNTEEIEYIKETIVEEVKNRKIKISKDITIDMYIFSLRNFIKDSNFKEEEWANYLSCLKDFELISIFLEVISVFNLLKNKAEESFGLLNLNRRSRAPKKILSDIDHKFIIYLLLIMRIYSISKDLTMGRIKEAFEKSKYLSFEKMYLV